MKKLFTKILSSLLIEALSSEKGKAVIATIMIEQNLKAVDPKIRDMVGEAVGTFLKQSSELYGRSWRDPDCRIQDGFAYAFMAADRDRLRAITDDAYGDKLRMVEAAIKNLNAVDSEKFLDNIVARLKNKQLNS